MDVYIASASSNNDELLFPSELRRARKIVQDTIPKEQQKEVYDKRGFLLLQWPSSTYRKPNELSLEHEARLKPANTESAGELISALAFSEEMEVGEVLLPGDPDFGRLFLTRVQRKPGPQSVDYYYDTPQKSLIGQHYTFRERRRSSEFMTWSDGDDGLTPFNIELPFVGGEYGIVARLEFNFLSTLDRCQQLLEDSCSKIDDEKSPLCLAMKIGQFNIDSLIPAIEHTTTRHKYKIIDKNEASEQRDIFALNVDFIKASVIGGKDVVRYIDVDISGLYPISSQAALARLAEFTSRMIERFSLLPNPETKASRDLKELSSVSSE